jgi:hypothetical protein
MFSGFFGKGDKTAKPPSTDAVSTRGLEVVEDDPHTGWDLWEKAVAEQDSRYSGLESPPESDSQRLPMLAMDAESGSSAASDFNEPTQPMPLQEKPAAQRLDDSLRIIERHHKRIANTIRDLWGYKECSTYVNKLIMSGGDGMGQARIGFNQEAVAAMLVLTDLHDEEFGPVEETTGFGFSDSTMGTGWDGLR